MTFRRDAAGALQDAFLQQALTIATTLLVFVGSILLLPLIPRQFFPSSDRPELLVDLTLPQNASIHASAATMSRLEALLPVLAQARQRAGLVAAHQARIADDVCGDDRRQFALLARHSGIPARRRPPK